MTSGTIARDVRERNLAGGSISLISQGSVLMNEGARLDVSGGRIKWEGGIVRTSQLLGADGKIYDISEADRNRAYVAVMDKQTVKDMRWGTEASYSFFGLGAIGSPEAAYVEGKDAGSVSIVTPRAVIDGVIDGRTTIGAVAATRAGCARGGSALSQLQPAAAGRTADIRSQHAGYDRHARQLCRFERAHRGRPEASSLLNANGSPFDPLKDPLPASLTDTGLRPSTSAQIASRSSASTPTAT